MSMQRGNFDSIKGITMPCWNKKVGKANDQVLAIRSTQLVSAKGTFCSYKREQCCILICWWWLENEDKGESMCW